MLVAHSEFQTIFQTHQSRVKRFTKKTTKSSINLIIRTRTIFNTPQKQNDGIDH